MWTGITAFARPTGPGAAAGTAPWPRARATAGSVAGTGVKAPVQVVDGVAQTRRVHVQRVRLDVDEHRHCLEVANDFRRRGERIGCRQDEIAGLDVGRFERQVHRGGAGVDRDREPGANVGGEFLLELMHLRTGRDPTGLEHVLDLGQFLVSEVGQGKRKVVGALRHTVMVSPVRTRSSLTRRSERQARKKRWPRAGSTQGVTHSDLAPAARVTPGSIREWIRRNGLVCQQSTRSPECANERSAWPGVNRGARRSSEGGKETRARVFRASRASCDAGARWLS